MKDGDTFSGFKFKFKRVRQFGTFLHTLTVFNPAGEAIGYLETGHCFGGEWSQIRDAAISPSMRGQGLYPVMLTKMRDFVQQNGCWGLVSANRVGDLSTRSWQKFAKREPRVREDSGDYYLSEAPGGRGFIGR